jgi:hypothetical protein
MEIVPTPLDLSANVYFVLFAVGASFLAMWVHLRFPTFGPDAVPMITAHMVASVLGANLIAPVVLRSAGSDVQLLALTFAVVLPLVVYMFLTAIWLIRFGQSMLARYSR